MWCLHSYFLPPAPSYSPPQAPVIKLEDSFGSTSTTSGAIISAGSPKLDKAAEKKQLKELEKQRKAAEKEEAKRLKQLEKDEKAAKKAAEAEAKRVAKESKKAAADAEKKRKQDEKEAKTKRLSSSTMSSIPGGIQGKFTAGTV